MLTISVRLLSLFDVLPAAWYFRLLVVQWGPGRV